MPINITIPRGSGLHARDIPWRMAPAVWADSAPVVEAAVEHLADLADDDTAAVVEHLLGALADAADELRAVRVILHGAMAEAHDLGTELRRTRQRYHALLDERRAALRAREAA